MLTKVLPEDNDESVEYVEPIADILDEPVCGELEHHLSREDDGKHHVRQLNNLHRKHVFSAFFLAGLSSLPCLFYHVRQLNNLHRNIVFSVYSAFCLAGFSYLPCLSFKLCWFCLSFCVLSSFGAFSFLSVDCHLIFSCLFF
jgi:hypothetical protein